jgi:hypothetical protein
VYNKISVASSPVAISYAIIPAAQTSALLTSHALLESNERVDSSGEWWAGLPPAVEQRTLISAEARDSSDL